MSDFLRRDPSVVIINDFDQAHSAMGSDAPTAGRNVLTLGGGAEPGGQRHSNSPNTLGPQAGLLARA